MTKEPHETACAKPGFDLIEELGHTEGVDWDLGRCPACEKHFLQQWSEHAPDRVFYDELTAEEADAFRRSQGRARLMLLKKWYADH
jgi:hypothetical protein